jgi:hypothetical protein
VDAEPEEGRVDRWRERLSPWSEQASNFRNEGFYERFPAKGQVERVARIHRELCRLAGLTPQPSAKKESPRHISLKSGPTPIVQPPQSL